MAASVMMTEARDRYPAGADTGPGATPANAWADLSLHPATSLRRIARSIASDPMQRNDRTAMAELIRPIVAAAREQMRGGRHQRYGAGDQKAAVAAAGAAADWSRVADAGVLEAYRMARFQSGQASILAPLTVVAIGSYGAGELRPERPMQLLLLAPDDQRELAGRRMARHLLQNLRAMGFAVAATIRTAGSRRDNGETVPAGAAAGGRLLTGSATLWVH